MNKPTKMLVSILTEKPIFSKVSRGGFFGITLFDQEFLGIYLNTYTALEISVNPVRYRQVYIGGYFFFYGVGLSISYDIGKVDSAW